MNKLVTIITPTTIDDARIEYLRQLHYNLEEVNETIPIEWVISINRNDDKKLPAFLDSPFIKKIYLKQNYGAAVARNMGLALASGKYVTTCDDDDFMPLHSISSRLRILEENPQLKWVAGLLADVSSSGLVSVWDCPAPHGFNSKGALWKTWGEPSSMFPLGPTTMMVERQALRSVGGWQGLPQGEDFGMVMAVTSAYDGFMSDEVVYYYRKHEHQMMNSAHFDDLEAIVRIETFERGRIV